MPSSSVAHVAEVGDRDADLADLAAGELVVGVVAGLGGQVEGHRQAGLALGQVAAVQLVGARARRNARRRCASSTAGRARAGAGVRLAHRRHRTELAGPTCEIAHVGRPSARCGRHRHARSELSSQRARPSPGDHRAARDAARRPVGARRGRVPDGDARVRPACRRRLRRADHAGWSPNCTPPARPRRRSAARWSGSASRSPGVLQRAHETAEKITAQSRMEAEDRLERARREAAEIDRGRRAAGPGARRRRRPDLGRARADRRRRRGAARGSCWPWPRRGRPLPGRGDHGRRRSATSGRPARAPRRRPESVAVEQPEAVPAERDEPSAEAPEPRTRRPRTPVAEDAVADESEAARGASPRTTPRHRRLPEPASRWRAEVEDPTVPIDPTERIDGVPDDSTRGHPAVVRRGPAPRQLTRHRQRADHRPHASRPPARDRRWRRRRRDRRPGPDLAPATRCWRSRRRPARGRCCSPTSISITPAPPARWCERWPELQVYVHERGARHLADPERLLQQRHAALRRRHGAAVGRDAARARGRTCACSPAARRCSTALRGRLHARARLPSRLLSAATGRRSSATWAACGSRRTRSRSRRRRRPTSTSRLWHESIDTVRGWAPERLAMTHFGEATTSTAQLDEVDARLDALVAARPRGRPRPASSPWSARRSRGTGQPGAGRHVPAGGARRAALRGLRALLVKARRTGRLKASDRSVSSLAHVCDG